jgi:hypothetical protein
MHGLSFPEFVCASSPAMRLTEARLMNPPQGAPVFFCKLVRPIGPEWRSTANFVARQELPMRDRDIDLLR